MTWCTQGAVAVRLACAGGAGSVPDLVGDGSGLRLRQAGRGLRERPEGLQQETGQQPKRPHHAPHWQADQR